MDSITQTQLSSDDGSGELPPAYLGRFRLDGELGRGGMGAVLRAYDSRLHRPVALKRILAGHSTPKARARLWREARTLAALRHPGIVQLHDVLEDADGALVLAMELIEGTPVSQVLGAPWSAARAMSLALMVARALGHAHAAGVVHRDIKASNLLLQPDGQVRVIDFGLARHHDDVTLTQDGAMVGTLSTMAPEQITGEAIAAPTDVYALGSLLYQLLAGTAPHARDSREATVAAVLSGARKPLREVCPDLAPQLAALVERCLARAPSERYTDGDALAEAIAEVARGQGLTLGPQVLGDGSSVVVPPRAPARRWVWGLAAVVAVGGAVTGVLLATATAETVLPCGPAPVIQCDEARLVCEMGRPPPAGLMMWLDAGRITEASPNQPLARWPDLGPKGFDLVQGEASARPTLTCDAMGGWPAVRADGVDDALATAANFPLTGDPAFTVFTVLRARKNATKNAVVWSWGIGSFGGAGSFLVLSADAMRWATGFYKDAATVDGSFESHLDTPSVVTLTREKGSIGDGTTLAYNGLVQETTGPELVPAIVDGPFSLGSWTTRQPASVDIAELIVYDYALHMWARQEIECWLGAKYGIDVSGCDAE